MRLNGISLKLIDAQTPPNTIAARALKKSEDDIISVKLIKRSVDARDKRDIRIVLSLEVAVKGEEEIVEVGYAPPADCALSDTPPIIVGAGPAGLFAAYILAHAGLKPILLERGAPIEERMRDAQALTKSGVLNTESNFLFGEGGAGTFSDGKLTSGTKDERIPFVLKTLVELGAPHDIVYTAKPHVGTDVLSVVVKNLRDKLIAMGCDVKFRCRVDDLIVENNALVGLKTTVGDITTNNAIFAIGHSARDTLRMINRRGANIEKKAFSIGVRVEHPQRMINFAQYGDAAKYLPPADYKLAVHLKNGRGAYTFCMCPGGNVVPATAQEGCVVTNGMSLHARDGENANAGLLIGITPDDFPGDALSGIDFQETWERAAFALGGGGYRAPVQQVGDFLKGISSRNIGAVKPTYAPGVTPGDLALCLPEYVTESLREAIRMFDRRIAGFAFPGAMLTGVETRSSSPVRVTRDECGQSNIAGLYPCGEGAGYAGGIISAAVDGIRSAEQVILAMKV